MMEVSGFYTAIWSYLASILFPYVSDLIRDIYITNIMESIYGILIVTVLIPVCILCFELFYKNKKCIQSSIAKRKIFSNFRPRLFIELNINKYNTTNQDGIRSKYTKIFQIRGHFSWSG